MPRVAASTVRQNYKTVSATSYFGTTSAGRPQTQQTVRRGIASHKFSAAPAYRLTKRLDTIINPTKHGSVPPERRNHNLNQR